MFANYDEISACFKEGSVTLNRGKVRSGLDFARAVSKLGVDRGIDQFQRFIFLKRSGDNDVAVPLGRFNVKSNPLVDLMSDLDRNRWLDSLRLFSRSKDAPGQTRHMTRRLEDGIFSLTQKSDRNTLQGILVLLGQIQLQSANSKKGRESVSPLPLISPEWVIEADDNSHEFRLACALAGLKEMRYNIVPLKINGKANEWDIDSPFAVWGGGDLTANLIKILERRLLRALQEGEEEKPLVGYPQTDLAAVMAFARGETDDRRIAGLLAGLVNADLPRHLPARTISSDEAPAAYKLLKPLFTPDDVLQRMAILPPGKHLPLSRKIVSLLKTGNSKQTTRSLAAVWRCLKNAGLKLPNHPNRPPDVVGIDSARLAAALMVPLTTADMSRICKPFTPKQDVPHFKEETPTDSIP
jgi:CRISPR-associated protein Csx17